MLAPLFPLALVNSSVSPVHLSVALSLVLDIVALIHIAALPGEDPITMLLVHEVLALILVASSSIVFSPLSLPLFESVLEIADVKAPVFPLILSESLGLAFVVLTLIGISVAEKVRAMAMLETV